MLVPEVAAAVISLWLTVALVELGAMVTAAGSGLVAVPAEGDQDAVGLVLPHHRSLLFSYQIVPFT
jgi:hypothetical protein